MNEDDPLQAGQNMIGALGIDLSPGALVAGFLFSVVGIYAYRLGKKHEKPGVLWSGITMMVYPLFISGALKLWLAGLGLCAIAYYYWTKDDSI